MKSSCRESCHGPARAAKLTIPFYTMPLYDACAAGFGFSRAADGAGLRRRAAPGFLRYRGPSAALARHCPMTAQSDPWVPQLRRTRMPTAVEEKDAIREVLAEYCFRLDDGRFAEMAAL